MKKGHRRDTALAVFRRLGFSLGRRGPLLGAYRYTSDFCGCAQQHIKGRIFRNVVESSIIDRGLPFWEKGFPADFFSDQRTIHSSECWVAELPFARVFTHRGSVLSADHRLLFDLSPQHSIQDRYDEVHRHHAMRCLVFPTIERVDGTVLSLLTPAGGNFFHWITEVLPRLHLALHAFPGLREQVDLILVNRDSGFAQKTLDWLEIPRQKIRLGTDMVNLEARSLIVPSLPGVTNAIPEWVLKWLREAFLPFAKRPGKLEKGEFIYIARGKSPRRKIINEEEWIRQVEGLGFTTIYPEDFSFEEQIWIFSHAKCVVGSHGAGLTNLIWCQPGTAVFEIFLNDHFTPAYWSISNGIGLGYGVVRYSSGESSKGSARQVGQDVKMPIEETNADLAEFLTKVSLQSELVENSFSA